MQINRHLTLLLIFAKLIVNVTTSWPTATYTTISYSIRSSLRSTRERHLISPPTRPNFISERCLEPSSVIICVTAFESAMGKREALVGTTISISFRCVKNCLPSSPPGVGKKKILAKSVSSWWSPLSHLR